MSEKAPTRAQLTRARMRGDTKGRSLTFKLYSMQLEQGLLNFSLACLSLVIDCSPRCARWAILFNVNQGGIFKHPPKVSNFGQDVLYFVLLL